MSFLGIGVPKPGRPAFNVSRDADALTIAVRDPEAGRFGVSCRDDGVSLWAMYAAAMSGFVIHLFTVTGIERTLSFSGRRYGRVLIVGGGGSGGSGYYGGGGGAGGVVYLDNVLLQGNITLAVGDGAIGGQWDTHSSGAGSRFGDIVAYGGGFGSGQGVLADIATPFAYGAAGGGSGGGGTFGHAAGVGTTGQGHGGGEGAKGTLYGYLGDSGGGGGGAQMAGEDAASNRAGDGGAGVQCAIMHRFIGGDEYGAYDYYGGGGGGVVKPHSYAYVNGAGGIGGGGDGAWLQTDPEGANAGVDGTGGGGGAGGSYHPGHISDAYGGSGGSGIVIVRYPRIGFGDTGGDEVIYLDENENVVTP